MFDRIVCIEVMIRALRHFVMSIIERMKLILYFRHISGEDIKKIARVSWNYHTFYMPFSLT